MKNLSNSLFKKFEPNQINNLSKIIGGQSGKTKWGSGDNSGCDYFYASADYKCIDTDIKDHTIGGQTHNGDMVHTPC